MSSAVETLSSSYIESILYPPDGRALYARRPFPPLPLEETEMDENRNSYMRTALELILKTSKKYCKLTKPSGVFWLTPYFSYTVENENIRQFYINIFNERIEKVRTQLKAAPELLTDDRGGQTSYIDQLALSFCKSHFVGSTVLHGIALLHTNSNTLDAILKESDQKSLRSIINRKNVKGMTALHYALSHGERLCPEIVHSLIIAGTSLTINIGTSISTNLHTIFRSAVIYQAQFDCLDLVLKFHPESIAYKDHITNILIEPSNGNFPKVLTELVNSYLPAYCAAAVNTPDEAGRTPLSYAIDYAHSNSNREWKELGDIRLKAIFILLEAGANPLLPFGTNDYRNDEGKTILECAYKISGSYQLLRSYCSAKALAEMEAKAKREKSSIATPKASRCVIV